MTTARTNPYLGDSVGTASPGRLLVMLYDRLALDLDRATAACEQGVVETAHDALVHAQEILAELHATLDVDTWPAAQNLRAVYAFLIEELAGANADKNPARVAACRRIVAPLHAAWREAAGVIDPPTAFRLGA